MKEKWKKVWLKHSCTRNCCLNIVWSKETEQKRETNYNVTKRHLVFSALKNRDLKLIARWQRNEDFSQKVNPETGEVPPTPPSLPRLRRHPLKIQIRKRSMKNSQISPVLPITVSESVNEFCVKRKNEKSRRAVQTTPRIPSASTIASPTNICRTMRKFRERRELGASGQQKIRGCFSWLWTSAAKTSQPSKPSSRRKERRESFRWLPCPAPFTRPKNKSGLFITEPGTRSPKTSCFLKVWKSRRKSCTRSSTMANFGKKLEKCLISKLPENCRNSFSMATRPFVSKEKQFTSGRRHVRLWSGSLLANRIRPVKLLPDLREPKEVPAKSACRQKSQSSCHHFLWMVSYLSNWKVT